MYLQIKNEKKKVNINLIKGDVYLVASQCDDYRGIAFIVEKNVIVVYEHADYIPKVIEESDFFREYNIIREIDLDKELITITLDDKGD